MKSVVNSRFTQATIRSDTTQFFQPITVTVADEGGGPFLLLDGPLDPQGGVRIDLEELEEATKIARIMITAAQTQ